VSDIRSVSAIIRGRVQGVFYRAWTKKTADRLGLAGWVRNREDGTVEALFSGPADRVDDMIAQCRKGPLGARVDEIATVEAQAPTEHGFTVLKD
jgi:acylphosphatase